MFSRSGNRRQGTPTRARTSVLATLAAVAALAAVLARPEHGRAATVAWLPAAVLSWAAVLSGCTQRRRRSPSARERKAAAAFGAATLDGRVMQVGASFLAHEVSAGGATLAQLVHPADLSAATDLELEALAMPGRTAAGAMRIFDVEGYKWFEVRLMSRRGSEAGLAASLRETGEAGTFVPVEGNPHFYDARSRAHVSLQDIGRLRDKVRDPEAWAGGPERPIALLLVEVGAYAEVAASRGAACAEELMARTAARMTLRLGKADLLTRLSTSTLGVLVGAAQSEYEFENLANHLYHLFSAPVVIDGRACATQVCIGASRGSDAGGMPMLTRAELALRSAGRQLHGRVVWFGADAHLHPQEEVRPGARSIAP